MRNGKLLKIEYLLADAEAAFRAFSPKADEDLAQHLEAWQEARHTYFFVLADSNHEIAEENLSVLQDHVEAMSRAAQAGDYSDFMSESMHALSALPGDPTIGLKPPKPKAIAKQR
jgi:hypothetical protein